MSPLLVIGIPMTLIVIGIVLNSFHIVHDQPEFSLEDDPVSKLAAERRAHYDFFHLQRSRILKRQKRVGQFACLVLSLFVLSSWWLYADTVSVTTESKQISSLETLSVADSDKTVLSVTLVDGSTVQYLVNAMETKTSRSARMKIPSQTLQSWELASTGTAVDVGSAVVPLGMALRISR